MVGGTWIEHVTSSVSRKRSPTELTAPGRLASILYGGPEAFRAVSCEDEARV